MSRRHHALSPSCCVVAHLFFTVAAHLFFTVAAHHQRHILCHQFESGYGFDSDDELQRLIKIEKLDAAATKLQKVYKSYRTRRNLADCAVVVEELWWKTLDFATLKRSSVSFFDVEKQESAVSRWARARTRAAKVANLRERFEQHRHVLSWPKTLVNKWFNIKCKTDNFQGYFSEFIWFYNFVFFMCRETGQKNI
ncbi:hypothetical protein S245_071287, partial [Arachis hypogaea]